MSPAATGGLVSEFFCCGLPSVLLQLLTPVFCHTDTDAPGECMDSERASVHAPAKGSLAPTDIGYKLSKQVRRPASALPLSKAAGRRPLSHHYAPLTPSDPVCRRGVKACWCYPQRAPPTARMPRVAGRVCVRRLPTRSKHNPHQTCRTLGHSTSPVCSHFVLCLAPGHHGPVQRPGR